MEIVAGEIQIYKSRVFTATEKFQVQTDRSLRIERTA